MSFNLCQVYPALDPFRIDELPFLKVAEIYRKTIEVKRWQDPEHMPKPGEIKTTRNGREVLLRPAGDNWF